MIARLHRAAAAATLALAVGLPVCGQSVLLRMTPAEGMVSRYVMGMETRMEAPMMPSDQPFMVGQIYQTQTITGVEGDVFEVQMVTDSANIETPAMPMMQGQMPDMTGQVQTMKMDARGRVVEMSGEDLPPEAEQMMGAMGGNGFGMELPEEPIGVGDSWSAKVEMNMPGPSGEMTMEMNVTYTLVGVDGDVANISYEGPIVMSGEGAGMEASGTVMGSIAFDTERSRIESSETQVSIDMNLSGMTMGMNQSVTMKLVR